MFHINYIRHTSFEIPKYYSLYSLRKKYRILKIWKYKLNLTSDHDLTSQIKKEQKQTYALSRPVTKGIASWRRRWGGRILTCARRPCAPTESCVSVFEPLRYQKECLELDHASYCRGFRTILPPLCPVAAQWAFYYERDRDRSHDNLQLASFFPTGRLWQRLWRDRSRSAYIIRAPACEIAEFLRPWLRIKHDLWLPLNFADKSWTKP